MKPFKNNLAWIIFMVFFVSTLVMLLTTGPNPFSTPAWQYTTIVEPDGTATEAPAATEPAKFESSLADAKRSNQLRRLARMMRDEGKLYRALELHRQSLALETKLDNTTGIAIQHDNIAAVFKTKGETARACAAWEAGLAALGPAPKASRFSLAGQGTGERLRRRILKSRQETGCPQ